MERRGQGSDRRAGAGRSMLALTGQIRFRDNKRAISELAELSEQLPEAVRNRLAVLLANSADPDGALLFLSRIVHEQPTAFQRIAASPVSLQYLITIFSHSAFLSDELLKTPQWLDPLPGAGDMHRVLSAEEYCARLETLLAPCGPVIPPAEVLALFRRRQIMRILLRDVLRYATLSDIVEELSNLADAILEQSYVHIYAHLQSRYGTPRYVDETTGAQRDCGCAVLALGKLGGRALNYSSDIDLMFIYTANGETSGPEVVSNKEFFKKLAVQLTELLSTYTAQGLCYRVDLRLRPEGSLGEVCISLDGARHYYSKRARDWELQMLIKARVAAGHRKTGRALLEFVEPLIYSTTLDFKAIEAVSDARERIGEKLARRRGGKGEFNIKLAPGGIRDIEFLVQCLQRLHGGREPWVRHGGTLLALFRLRDKEKLSDYEYSQLASAYQFLRNLEHRLQVEHDLQTHALPENPDKLELLARRMDSSQLGTDPSAALLIDQVHAYLEAVREIYERVIRANNPLYYYSEAAPFVASPGEEPPTPPPPPEPVDPQTSSLIRSLDQRAPGLAGSLSRLNIRRGAAAFELFLEKVLDNPAWLRWLDDDPALASYVVDLFEHSPFFAEQLNRKPDLIEELRQLPLPPEKQTQYAEMPPLLADPVALRRFFSREMLRIQSESICLRRPIFETLRRTSDLADCVIATAYSLAVEHTVAKMPPATAGYVPRDQMMVVALGRLGMLEFDLASDADLVFVLPDRDGDECVFWTRVANRLINLITAYTGEGVLFSVDTRLRPNGREGSLVQTEGTYKDYFSQRAEAWEGITYLKSRAVAGNVERSTAFLNELQEVDWRRYGQSGRSREQLREMRMRLEREVGLENPLKAGEGGYYDIDFALMFLRLKSAGIFYPVLNTPARIDVIEKMGHLDRADAHFLRDAATFYRAVDHGLRLSTGHAEGTLPGAPQQLEMLTDLVKRWTPDHLHDQPLPEELEQIRTRTREYFNRLFS
jgi:[glutamine synthetase] adenylyltransferase / [glutamine synthetase]-adenylyl-L-tyrosine phosphorylase